MVVIKILEVALLAIFVISNIYVAREMSPRAMYKKYIDGQCLIGKICANMFYAPAWILKFLKAAIMIIVA